MALKFLVLAILCVVATIEAQSADEVALRNVILNGGKLTLKNSITLTADLPLIPAGKTISITGALNGKKAPVTIDGQGLYAMFKSSGSGAVSLSLTNLIIQYSKVFVNGDPAAAVDISDFNSVLTVSNVVFQSNGRALYLGGTTAKISSSKFTNHKYTAVVLVPGTGAVKPVTITSCTFNANYADDTIGGGAIHVGGSDSGAGASVVVSKSTFSGNFATSSYGGAVELQGFATGTFRSCKFSSNFARQGGAVHAFNAYFTTVGCTFSQNSAADSGGAVWMESDGEGKNSLSTTTFSKNSATTSGGAFTINVDVDLTFCSCTFTSNTASKAANNGFVEGIGSGPIIFTTPAKPIPLVTPAPDVDAIDYRTGQPCLK